MSWYMKPDDRLQTQETARAQEAHKLLFLMNDTSQVDNRLYTLLYFVLSPDELEWLQQRFDQDNGDPRIPESERTNLGPVWPAAARRLLRSAIFNNKRRITEQLDANYETVVGADQIKSANFLTEDPLITITLNVLYGTEFPISKAPSTRLGMVSEMIWILIGATAKNLQATDCIQLVYAKVLDPFHTSLVPEGSFVMREVIFFRDGRKEGPAYQMGEKISSLDDVILLKHTILGPEGFLDRKDPSFSEQIRDIVSSEMREFIGGEWYLARNTVANVFK